MKKRVAVAVVLLAALAVVFFPIPTTRSLSGDGEILTRQKEKTGTCRLEVEVREVASLAVCYKRSFSFVLDGDIAEVFSSTSYSEADGICLLSQMYYDEEMDRMSLASLLYPEDLSYAVLCLDPNYYFLNNGSNISYAELPFSQ